jgi:dTDP-4-amino-4,6-dideoxy-D-galactose acyltransferase
MSIIHSLDWDSSFFGYSVGRVDIGDEKKFDFEAFQSESKNFKLIYVYSKNTLFYPNFKLVDKKVLLSQICHDFLNENIVFTESFDLKVHNIVELKKLALESGLYSRFKIDENFKSGEFESLYMRWIENAVNDELTFDIIVALKNNSIVGFATLNRKNDFLADIGLVAVSESVRGSGIGKQIIQECIIRSKKAGYGEIQVVTQLDNLAAMNLYKKTNFKIKEINNIYHLWNL